MAKTTTHWRIKKKLASELKYKFPEVRQADLIQIMYNTSLIKMEAGLRPVKKKKK